MKKINSPILGSLTVNNKKSNQRISNLLLKAFFALLFVIGVSLNVNAQATYVAYTAAGNDTWTCPPGVTSIVVKTWGAGGGGGGAFRTGTATAATGANSSGGGGGAYAQSTLTVVPGTVYKLTVGAGGAGGANTGANGAVGTNTFFGNSGAGNQAGATVVAAGGSGGIGRNSAGQSNGSTGGSIASSIGTIRFAGGNSSAASYESFASGGGSSAGSNTVAGGMTGTGIVGNNSLTPPAGGIAPLGGFAGGAGTNLTVGGTGTAGTAGGGGGGGSRRGTNSTNRVGGAGGRGRVEICFTLVPPANDACANATNLPCGTANLAGTTVNSVSETAPNSCVNGYGVWYSFVGDGQNTTISAYSAMDIGLYLGSGSCASRTNIQCVDDFSSSSTETSAAFTAVSGVTYYVYIANYNSTTTGTFTISRTCVAAPTPPSNDACANATNLPCGTTNLAGTTVNSVSETAPNSCVNGYGVWYSFVGDGQSTTISAYSTMDIGLYVGSGSCASRTNMQCVDNFSTSSTETSAAFTAVSGVTYYVYIANYNSTTTGTFTISRTCVAAPTPPSNDACANATNLPCATTNLAGTTVNSVSETAPNSCVGNYGVWYKFVGDGQMTAISVSSSVDLGLYIGSGNCASLSGLQCVDDYYTTETSTTFTSVIGTTYYIYVAYFDIGATTGAFTITRTCFTPPANDNCVNAQIVTIQCPVAVSPASGTTLNATEDAIADPTCDPGTINDVWYTFNSGVNTSVNLTVTLGTATGLGGQLFTSCGALATGITISGIASNCDYNLSSPSTNLITGLVANTTYRLRLFTNVTYDASGSFSFTLSSTEAAPTATITAAGSTNICSSQTVTLNSNTGAGYSYQWRLNGSAISGANTSSYIASLAGTYTVQVTNASGCLSATSTGNSVIVNPILTASVSISASGTTICTGTPVTFTATPTNGGAAPVYQWQLNGSNVGTNSTSYTNATLANGAVVTCVLTSNATPCLTGSPATSNDVSITVNTPASSFPVANQAYHVWNGKSSTDWSNEQNWYEYNGSSFAIASAAPSDINAVIIPATGTCVLNQPTASVNGSSCSSLLILPNAELIVNLTSQAQSFNTYDDVTVQSTGKLTILNGSKISIETGNLSFLGNAVFTHGNGILEFRTIANHANQHTILAESASNNIFYALDFYGDNNLTSYPFLLGSNISALHRVRVNSSKLDLNGKALDLGSSATLEEGNGQSGTMHIFDTPGTGYVRSVGVIGSTILGAGNTIPVEPGNLGLEFTPSANRPLGTTEILRYHKNSVVNTVSGDMSIKRMYHVIPQFNGFSDYSDGLNLKLVMEYHSENLLANVPENTLVMYRSDDGISNFENTGGVVEISSKKLTTTNFPKFSWITIAPSGSITSLPIELISFQANCTSEKAIAISWSTASEHNASHYIVEKSRNGEIWTELSVVSAAGNSTSVIEYETMDFSAAEGINYYRLTQFDNDGEKETFNIATTNCDDKITNHLKTYPNPSENGFYIDFYSLETPKEGKITITDSRGTELYSQDVAIEKGNNIFHIADLNAAPGMYYVKVSNGTKTYTIKQSLR
jgi:hypothetical protein